MAMDIIVHAHHAVLSDTLRGRAERTRKSRAAEALRA
jgi:hypothetical protein